jgi:sarcosine oxidase subunit gamma
MEVPKHFGAPKQEEAAIDELALADLSALPKFGVKGPGAAAWLEKDGLTIPEAIYSWVSLEEKSGRIIRTGDQEFFLEDGFTTDRVEKMIETFQPQAGVYPMVRQDAGFLLCGEHAPKVLAQTCGFDFTEPGNKVVFSRVAGVSCMLMATEQEDLFSARLWCPASYGIYLWTTLLEIVHDLGGMPIGLESL